MRLAPWRYHIAEQAIDDPPSNRQKKPRDGNECAYQYSALKSGNQDRKENKKARDEQKKNLARSMDAVEPGFLWLVVHGLVVVSQA